MQSGGRGAVMIGLLFALSACGAAQAAAQRDPMHCERDPSCAKSRGTYSDCSKQCVDDPACTDRCREAQMDQGLGH